MFPNDPLNTANTAWGMFAMTGGLGYYMLYKNLAEDDKMTQYEKEKR